MSKADEKRAAAQAQQLMLVIPQLAMGFKTLMGDAPKDAFPTARPSPRHIAVMMSLAALGPASVSELAARMNLTLTHASQIVGELAASGLVERREDDNDRRRTIASIAPGSKELLDAVSSDVTRPLLAFCRAMTAAETTQFVAQLELLVTLLTAGESDRGEAR